MKPNEVFLRQPKTFWANVRTISEGIGYTVRGERTIKIPTIGEIIDFYRRRGLAIQHLVDGSSLTETTHNLLGYLSYRSEVLTKFVEPKLMDRAQAREVFEELHGTLNPRCPIPMNKQAAAKKAPAYFTSIINMLLEANVGEYSCDYSPRQLTAITKDGAPLRTLARRVDGAFPTVLNPKAIWEIKEYYYTTTFGSRVADGIYETLLDGMEVEEIREHEGVDVKHYLMVDSRYTWWECGRSYLCRILDMLHMGYIDEALFGYEVVERLPTLVKEWISDLEAGKGRKG